jgi:poly [ADP-ribose] polymerase
MAPRKGSQATAVPPLDGCTIALSGTFSGFTQSALEKDYIEALGATFAKSVTASTTQ